jgi:hypothetical protein
MEELCFVELKAKKGPWFDPAVSCSRVATRDPSFFVSFLLPSLSFMITLHSSVGELENRRPPKSHEREGRSSLTDGRS